MFQNGVTEYGDPDTGSQVYVVDFATSYSFTTLTLREPEKMYWQIMCAGPLAQWSNSLLA